MKETSFSNTLDNMETYGFTWPGKKEASASADTPTTARLLPDRESSVDWDTTKNLFLEGDNLEVLKILQKKYQGKVKMIYIDPPYNTRKKFIYNDNFTIPKKEYIAKYNPQTEFELSGRYHTNWLNMMYPRLKLARNLLREDGVIFISIDDNEVHNLRKICDDIFGGGNFVGDIIWEKRYGRSNDARLMASVLDHILLYRKSDSIFLLREPRTEKIDSAYTNPDNDPRGPWTSVSFVSQRTRDERPNLSYEIINPYTGAKVEHPTNAWKYNFEKYQAWTSDNRFYWGKDGTQNFPRIKRFLSELSEGLVPVNLWKHQDAGTGAEGTKEVNELVGKTVFNYPKPLRLIKRVLGVADSIKSDDNIILDFFAGSATTAHAVMQLNAEDGGDRKFILVQLPEKCDEKSEAFKAGYKTIAEISKERIRRAGKKIKEENPETSKDLDIGFRVYKVGE